MKYEKIKPIPKYLLARILRLDNKFCPEQNGFIRFYAYLTKNDGELVKVTVAVKNHKNKRYCKQIAIHGVHSDVCFLKDMCYAYIGGFRVGWYAEGLQKYPKWYEYGEWGWNDDKYFDPWAPIVNREYLAQFPEYKYAAWELYNYPNIFKYLRTYEAYPQTEYLMKLGLKKLVFSKQILRKVSKDKKFCKWLILNKDELSNEYYYIKVIMQAYKTGKPLKILQTHEEARLKLQHDENLKPIKELFEGKDLERFFSYIAKQTTNTHTYLDYLKACNYLGVDMTIERNRFPHDFQYWHDIRIDEYASAKAMKDAEERKELYAKFSEIAEKYLELQNRTDESYAVIIAKSPAELIREGECLHHCVGRMGYDRKFTREETLIFFVRDVDKPDVPFVTVEYSLRTKKVLQCYGNGNSKPNESVLNYVNNVWLPYANRKLRKMNRTTKAA